MKPSRLFPLVLIFSIAAGDSLHGASPEIAKLLFGPALESTDGTATDDRPAWILGVEQKGGRYLETPPAWQVEGSAPEGDGQIEIQIDRTKMNEDLVATILFEAGAGADFAVQLFDAENRVVVVDLFGNLVDVGAEATTDTFVVSLRKYPSAEKIVLRRIKGEVKVYGVVLYPVVTEGEPVNEALSRLAQRLGDPLSPDNPLHQGLREVADHGKVAMTRQGGPAKAAAAGQPKRPLYTAAALPPVGGTASAGSTLGLVAHWSFDGEPIGRDLANGRHPLAIGGTVVPDEGVDGRGVRFSGAKGSGMFTSPSQEFALSDALTVSAWIKPAARKGGQIVWFGDPRGGRDPWLLYLHGDGRVRFRSDRAVTAKPTFAVRQQEIVLMPGGALNLNQHVAADSPGVLPLNEWSFITGRIEKVSAKQRAFSVFVNGEKVHEVRSTEEVDYTTDRMWVALGAVHKGDSQNYNGSIDEVRVYGRSLTDDEVAALYRLPRLQAPTSLTRVSAAP